MCEPEPEKEKIPSELSVAFERAAAERFGNPDPFPNYTPVCEHYWVYAPFVTTSLPPIRYKICRNCGEKISESIETPYYPNEYDFLLKKFSPFQVNDTTIDNPEPV